MLIQCPECSKKLRVNPSADPRKRIRCPQCSAVFVAADHGDTEKELPRSAARGAAKRVPDRDDDDDERDPDRPRARRRRRSDEEEDDERPVRRERKANRTSGDDEDDDRRPRRKKRKKQGGSAVLWTMLSGGVSVVVAITVFVIMIARGSGNYSQHEAAAQEALGLVKELLTVMESVQDPNTARLAAPRIISICERMEAAHQRSRSLGKITADENRRLQAKINAELASMQQRMQQVAFQAGVRSQGEPAFLAALKRLESLKNLAR